MKIKAWKRIAYMKIKAFHVVVGILVSLGIWLVVDAVLANSRTRTFAEYYEPCEPDVRLNFTDYTLPLDINDIVNFVEMGEVFDVNSVSDLIRQNGFAVMDANLRSPVVDFAEIYKYLKFWVNKPVFITTDTGLYLYHAAFDQILRDIEERLFIREITDMTNALLDDALENYNQLNGDLKEASRRNVAYLSVAQKLINPNAVIPDLVGTEVSSELAKIEAHQGMAESDIFRYSQDYSQYIPRGHYTRSEELKRYFKTMIWYGNTTFLLKGGSDGLISEQDAKIQTMQACMLAASLRNIQVGNKAGLEVWDEIYTITSFFVGHADDLTPKDYLLAIDKVFGVWFTVSDLDDEEKLFELKRELALLPSPEIYGGTGDVVVDGPIENLDDILEITKGMRLMGRRFVPDSYIFQHLIYPEVGRYTGDPNIQPFTADNTFGNRSYIRGLDLMAILGSDEAKEILTDDGDTNFENYAERFQELTTEFNSVSIDDWNQNLYWSRLYCLKSLLQELPEGYPNFMRTQAWHRSQLNTALASWTQLRHDTILYGYQGYAPPPYMPRVPPGYVEPNPVFWGRLLSLTRMTRLGLEDFNIQTDDILSPDVLESLNNLEEFIQTLLDIVIKQLVNEPLSEEDKKFFQDLEEIVSELAENRYTTNPTRVDLIADVHTFSYEQTVVEEAVGFINVIVVACPLAEGKAFLAAGPVFSYYEFKHPMADRLTDLDWFNILYSKDEPNRPNWYLPIMQQIDEPSDEDTTGIKILTDNYYDDGNPCWSPDGQRIVFERNYNIYIMNADGSEQRRLTNDTTYNSYPAWSPDGEKIAFASQSDIFVMYADGSNPENLTNSPDYEGDPCWSPDGQKIAYMARPAKYTSGTQLDYNIYVMNADGSDPVQLTDNPEYDTNPHWSPDGQKIAYSSVTGKERNYEIFIMSPDGSQKENLTNNPNYDSNPCWSPDGEKISFVSERDTQYYIYIMNADGTQRKEINNSVGLRSPSWSPDGKHLVCTYGIYGSRNICLIDLE